MYKNDSDVLNFVALEFCLKVLEENAFCRFAYVNDTLLVETFI